LAFGFAELAEVGADLQSVPSNLLGSGLLFFGSFAFGELAGVKSEIIRGYCSARFFWRSKRNEQINQNLDLNLSINQIKID
jgi:hypothetical protein